MPSETRREITPFGFIYGHLEVTRMFSEGNAVAIGIKNTVTGELLCVQTSRKGRKTHVTKSVQTPRETGARNET